jgi:hypothetical protein
MSKKIEGEKAEDFAEKAKKLFEANPGIAKLYFTADGLAFASVSDARNHGKTLVNQRITTIER